jgi:hypothetical protein
MKSSKFWLAVLVAGVVANILDYLVYTQWLGPTYMMSNPTLFRQDTNVAWYVVGDFVAVFVFAWIFNKVSGSFGSTVQDGAKAGLYLGIFANFPLWIFMHLMFNGYPYSLSWISTIYGIIWYVILGAVVAAMMKKGGSATAA